MQCYTELTPPTAVTCSLTLPFVSAQSNNLIVGKGSIIQVFTTKTISAELDHSLALSQPAQTTQKSTKSTTQYDSRLNDDDGLESSFLGGDAVLQRADRSTNTKLVLIAEVSLSGTVVDLARIKIADSLSGGDAILIHVRDAKMCLAQWDPAKAGFENISIHYYEQEDMMLPPWHGSFCSYRNFLTADPGSRCAVLKFGDKNIAILPFKQSDVDIEMDDWDEALDGPRPAKQPVASSAANGTSKLETPYLPSFVLRIPMLDSTLLHTVHFDFLYEYKEPTFGILSSVMHPAPNLPRRDHLTYKVFTLDLQQRASTQILAVTGLPQDLNKVIPLQAPVGGALLVGPDCMIHVDQSGKTNGVAVNEFAKMSTDFPLADQSSLNLRLEHSVIEPLSIETGELLMAMWDSRLAIVSFKLDGRTVSGISIQLVSDEAGGSILPSIATCVSTIGKNTLFIGSKDSDSTVIGWTRKQPQLSRRRSRLLDPSLEYDVDDLDLEDNEDDDLYGDGSAAVQAGVNGSAKSGELMFRVHDTLFSIAPILHFAHGTVAVFPDSEDQKNSLGITAELDLAAVVGKGAKGGSCLAILNREIQPKVVGSFEFPEARGFWTMSVQKPIPKSLQGDKGANVAVGNDYDTSAQYDKFMIVSKIDLDGYETSDVYALTSAGFEALTGTEFDPAAGFTVEAGTMGNHMRIIQVLKSEVRCYDGDLGLSQILPMLDEESGAEPRVVSASIADPFLLLVRDDSSIFVAQCDDNNELEEVDRESEGLLANKWLTGYLYVDSYGVFAIQNDKGVETGSKVLMFLVNAAGALHIYALPDLSKPVYVTEGLAYIPPILSADYAVRKGTQKETIAEIVVADIGDSTSQSPYLIVRHATDDLTIYEPVLVDLAEKPPTLSKSLHFKKAPNAALAKSPVVDVPDEAAQESRFVPLRSCKNIGGYSTVFLPGASPSFIVKSAKSIPKVIGLQGNGVRGMSAFHTEGCERGFIYADSAGIARVTQLPLDRNITDIGMSVKKVSFGTHLTHVTFHHPMECYVVACTTLEPFELPKDDEHHREWAREHIEMKPLKEHGQIKLISPLNWSVIDEIVLDPCEIVMSLETLKLEVSEETKERRMLITVGTGIIKGEDLPTKGRIYVYDVVTVIPEPGRPETNKKLKLIAREEIPRGAVTAITELNKPGLMLVSQGQKCMVRGLKEDGTLLPVAFMDTACYTKTVREMPGTGLIAMADMFKGVWFTGYTEEPFQLLLFGKSDTKLQTQCADFLPDGKELYIIAVSVDGDIHVLQFDPEHPRSVGGQRLLHRATFCTGPSNPTQTLLLPRTSPRPWPVSHQAMMADGALMPHILLMSSPSGQLAALVPLAETAYRRLVSVSNQLISILSHPAACNPKGYRMPRPDSRPPGVDAAVGRGVVDGAMLARWNELGSRHRAEIASKGGYASVDEVRTELECLLGWSGLAYF